jgi:tetraacyldisaccharide 4'-kinase
MLPAGESRLARLERRVRDSWSEDPGALLRIASVIYGMVHDTRDFLYDAAILQGWVAPVPVLSVGGLTSGGSGKTPVSAAIATWLLEGGRRPAVVTGSIPDEASVQRLLNPDVLVVDDRNRRAAVTRAILSGARTIVLDSGFQHRRIRSDLQIVCVDGLSVSLPARRRLPAGPFRERWSALARADAVVVVRRTGSSASDGSWPARRAGDPDFPRLGQGIRRRVPRALVLDCVLSPMGFRPANALAEQSEPGAASVAVAGVMWPEPFFDALEGLGVPAERRLAFRDHEPYGSEQLAAIRNSSNAGVICTLKDAVKLGPLLARELPVWYLEEKPVWGAGAERLRRGALRVGASGSASSRFGWHQGEAT